MSYSGPDVIQAPWGRRLLLPAYQISEVARYAGIAPSTVTAWHNTSDSTAAPLSMRGHKSALSYLQLIEVAVVASLREQRLTLKTISEARQYMSNMLKVEYPFARYTFKTDGRKLWMDYKQVVGKRRGKGKLLGLNESGQLAWDDVIGRRLKEFEYDGTGLVIKWKVAGPDSRVVIDPRMSFGAPVVDGVPTWVIASRRKAGESVLDIADDFGLDTEGVLSALSFEKMPFDEMSNVHFIA